jgi:hypothetical protein
MEFNSEWLQSVAMTVLNSCLWLLLLCIPLAAHGRGNMLEFPGPATKLESPDGKFIVENVDSDKEPHHVLLLRTKRTDKVRTLYAYRRQVGVLWSPDGSKVVVNDYAGSDFSTSLVFFVGPEIPPLDLKEGVLGLLKGSPELRSITDNGHVYFEVARWDGNNAVRLKVWGYGEIDPKGFSRKYLYDLRGHLRRLDRTRGRLVP